MEDEKRIIYEMTYVNTYKYSISYFDTHKQACRYIIPMFNLKETIDSFIYNISHIAKVEDIHDLISTMIYTVTNTKDNNHEKMQYIYDIMSIIEIISDKVFVSYMLYTMYEIEAILERTISEVVNTKNTEILFYSIDDIMMMPNDILIVDKIHADIDNGMYVIIMSRYIKDR